jgi:predicted TIM-barrel fold metal-dependent hydrolase
MLPLIILEEHCASSKVVGSHYSEFPQHVLSKLKSLNDERIQDMDKGDISLQVISHDPLITSLSACLEANDELAVAIPQNSKRLTEFAMLPMQDPKATARELVCCVKERGFGGALVDNHLDGQFYDDERFWPVFEEPQDLDVPIYLHSTFATDSALEHFQGNYDREIGTALSAYGWGWHTETGLHLLRLYCSEIFDKYKSLKTIIGHMGEMLPFQLDRIFSMSGRWGRERELREVWRTNIWVTTSGMFSLAPLSCLLQMSSMDHVLYSVDYPFSTNERGKEFIEQIRKSNRIDERQLEMFAYRKAESLLKVKAKSG